MKISLHCNYPDDPKIANASLGYLKGFLSKNGWDIHNIYWNLVPQNLAYKFNEVYNQLTQYLGYIIPCTFLSACFSKVCYSNSPTCLKDVLNLQGSIGTTFPVTLINEILTLSQDYKNYFDATIETQSLPDVDIAGFTMKIFQWVPSSYILTQLKKQNPNIKIIIGGISSQHEGLAFMKMLKHADFAIWGEGEIPLEKLIQTIDDPSMYQTIPNLIYRQKNDLIRTHALKIEDLPDVNQYPFADHTDFFNTLEKNGYAHESAYIPIWCVRSCNWAHCKFCVANEGYFYRERSPETIVDEIEYQAQKHSTNRFIFVDNDIGRKRKEDFDRFLQLLVESSNRRIQPYQLIQGDIIPIRLDRQSIELLKKIGIYSIQIGFEATTDTLLQKMMKKHRFIHNLQAFKLAEEQNFKLMPNNVITDIPSETEEDVDESITNLIFLRFLVHKFPLSNVKLILFKGAPFYNEVSLEQKEKNWIIDPFAVWQIIRTIPDLPIANRWDFFGFSTPHSAHFSKWSEFNQQYKKYLMQKLSYTWFEKNDGSSCIEEHIEIGKNTRGIPQIKVLTEHTLNTIQTELLSYCDTMKTFEEIKNHFPELKEDALKQMLYSLKQYGLLYCDASYRMSLSIISTKYKIPIRYKNILQQLV